MIIILKKDAQGKFLPPPKEEIEAALAATAADTHPQKHNEPVIEGQCVLLTAIQGMNEAKGVALEEIGL